MKFYEAIKIVLIISTLFFLSACNPVSNQETTTTSTAFSPEKRLQNLNDRMLDYLPKIPLDSTSIPRTIEPDGSLKGTKSKSWTSGFFPGMLWELYGFSKDEKLKQAAVQWQAFVEKEKFDA